jgi:hypothetical protein
MIQISYPYCRMHHPYTTRSICLCIFLLVNQQSSAVILYSGDNAANQTAPDASRTDIFNSIGRVCTSTGGGARGSVVQLRGKYLLTANHVNVSLNYVTFDGSTYWARDTAFTPIKIGVTDMKLIKLKEDPNLQPVSLYTSLTSEVGVTATLVGWGVGRNSTPSPAGRAVTWEWGNTATLKKRWGTNAIDTILTENSPPFNIDYEALVTSLSTNTGDNEAAAAVYDSGSGLFIQNIQNGSTWELAGLTTLTSATGSSTFDVAGQGDLNLFVRISTYAADIEAAIPDIETYSGWKVDHILYGTDAEDSADTDDDGIGQLLEFAFGGDPHENDISILPRHGLTEDSGSTYLEISYTRPTFSNGLSYTVKTTTDLTSWPADSSGVGPAAIVNNGDGTQTETYRRTLAVESANEAFIRVDVSISP